MESRAVMASASSSIFVPDMMTSCSKITRQRRWWSPAPLNGHAAIGVHMGDSTR